MSNKPKKIYQEKDNMDKDDILKELLSKQLKNIPSSKKLQFSDVKRISKYIDSSIFDENRCCLWDGYVTNMNNTCKGTYINFFFRKKKVALHRLLYVNFVGSLSADEYLKFNCENKGKCCNVFHLKKYKYQKKDSSEKKETHKKHKPKKKNERKEINLYLEFD